MSVLLVLDVHSDVDEDSYVIRGMGCSNSSLPSLSIILLSICIIVCWDLWTPATIPGAWVTHLLTHMLTATLMA